MRSLKGYTAVPSVFTPPSRVGEINSSGVEQAVWLDEYAKYVSLINTQCINRFRAVALCKAAMQTNVPHPYRLVTEVLKHNLALLKRKRGFEGARQASSPTTTKKKKTRLDPVPQEQPPSEIGNKSTAVAHRTNHKRKHEPSPEHGDNKTDYNNKQKVKERREDDGIV